MKIEVMIAGLPGKMAYLVATQIEEAEDFFLSSEGLSRESLAWLQIGDTTLRLHPMEFHKKIILNVGPDIIVDFTHPDSVNRNAQLYCECEIPFVMGTTGGDRELLMKTVENSSISAVIAPNMAKQIVGFQAMMEYAANTFPNLFNGYTLKIVESHQKGKADTSGTAKAMVQYFNKLGIPFQKKEIVMIRDPTVQKEQLGVPSEHLNGHGWHTYTLCSKDETVLFQFTHNVNGREIYAQGALDAIRFLAKHQQPGKVFSMIDVLKEQ